MVKLCNNFSASQMGILIEMFISNMERTRNDRREKLFNNKWQKINKKHYGQTEKNYVYGQ